MISLALADIEIGLVDLVQAFDVDGHGIDHVLDAVVKDNVVEELMKELEGFLILIL